jgi:hypothetical protein
MKEHIAQFGTWCSGKTQDNDPRIKQARLKAAVTLKKTLIERGHWSTGLTKDNDERIKRRGRNISKTFQERKPWENLSDEKKLARSEAMRQVAKISHVRQRLTLEETRQRLISLESWIVISKLDQEWHDKQRSILDANVEFKCVHCLLIATIRLGSIFAGRKCPCQYKIPENLSLPEQELADFVASLLEPGQVTIHERNLLFPLELDVYIPSKKLAFEFNGLYWHSQHNLSYHETKSIAARSRDVNLFHVFEDEWTHKRKILESMIKVKLHHPSIVKIGARKCEVIVHKRAADLRQWFDSTHIDGYVNSKVGFSLQLNGVIVAALTLRLPFHRSTYPNTIEIARFSSALDTVVPGAFSRLFKEAIKWAQIVGFKQIISYRDTRFGGSGACYQQEMEMIKVTSPAWWWTDFKHRVNRFTFRAQPNKPEVIVGKEAGYVKIGGCSSELYQYVFP